MPRPGSLLCLKDVSDRSQSKPKFSLSLETWKERLLVFVLFPFLLFP